MVWYTDGLVECRDGAGQQYGWKRLVSAVQRFGDLPADQLREALLADARAFSVGHAEDDITVVVAEYMPAVAENYPAPNAGTTTPPGARSDAGDPFAEPSFVEEALARLPGSDREPPAA
jgi:hypothetical protein